jgi:hypothetical protein
VRDGDGFEESAASALLGVTTDALVDEVDWP